MVATWIESGAKGRHGGPVRAGMWSALVVGTHPIEADQEVCLELFADDIGLGCLPGFWLENKGVNSFWHVPIPPQGIGTRLRYRSGARKDGSETSFSPWQEIVVRPNLPDPTEIAEVDLIGAEGLVGNRAMTARVDGRGSTFDVYFPTVGLHSDVRPAEGDLSRSRSHFRFIMAGLAIGRRLDWFSERLTWDAFQHYQGATNLLSTELKWRRGPFRVLATDFVVMGKNLPRSAGDTDSPGQYIKRYRIFNEGMEAARTIFAVYVMAEVNGGIGETGLSWIDSDRALLASNRGHGHANRKLARDATVEFAIAFDDRGQTHCEPTGPKSALLYRWIDIPAQGSTRVDLIVSGAFTGWRADIGTFEHWLRPALTWFRAGNLDEIEQETAAAWDDHVEPVPSLRFSKSSHAVTLRRSVLAAALHADQRWGGIASDFDRGINAYCWPREAIWAGGAVDRAGHVEIGRAVFEWLGRVRNASRPFAYWFQKYTIDGWPEWETPAADQTALIPWALERHYRRAGDLDFVSACWPMVEQAAAVCGGASGHPGLSFLDDLGLISSAGIWDSRFGAFFYTNASVVAGLRAAARLSAILGKPDAQARGWSDLADRIWHEGVLREAPAQGGGPGLIDAETGRFLDARRLSTRRGLWTDRPEWIIERSQAIDISLLGASLPFELLPALDPRIGRCAEAILKHNAAKGESPLLVRWALQPDQADRSVAPTSAHRQDPSSLATLWMVRYLIKLGRETGDARHWTRASSMLDAVINRLCPLGLSIRLPARRGDGLSPAPRPGGGVWGLHAMLIESLLDFAGLDYDAAANAFLFEPAFPADWPSIGFEQPFSKGKASYVLDRLGPNAYRLVFDADLKGEATLRVDLTCPGLHELGGWTCRPFEASPPEFDSSNGRLRWNVVLPAGRSSSQWTWSGSSNGREAAGLQVEGAAR